MRTPPTEPALRTARAPSTSRSSSAASSVEIAPRPRPAAHKRCVDLAAARGRADGAAKIGLGGAQFLGQAEADLEVAVVDAADLPDEQPGGVARSARAKPVMLLSIGLTSLGCWSGR